MEEPFIDIEDLEFDGDMLVLDEVPFTGTVVEYYSDGSLCFKGSYVKGFQQGVSREWYKDGVLKEESNFLRGLKHGESQKWDENGQLKSKQFCNNGWMNREIVYGENGAIVSDETFGENPRLKAIYQKFIDENL